MSKNTILILIITLVILAIIVLIFFIKTVIGIFNTIQNKNASPIIQTKKNVYKNNLSYSSENYDWGDEDNDDEYTSPVFSDESSYNCKVVGVTYINSDGTSRQDLLFNLYNNQEPFKSSVNLTLEDYLYNSEPAVKVLANEYQLGNVPADCAAKVISLMNQHPDMKIGCKIYKVQNKDIYGMYLKLRW